MFFQIYSTHATFVFEDTAGSSNNVYRDKIDQLLQMIIGKFTLYHEDKKYRFSCSNTDMTALINALKLLLILSVTHFVFNVHSNDEALLFLWSSIYDLNQEILEISLMLFHIVYTASLKFTIETCKCIVFAPSWRTQLSTVTLIHLSTQF